MSVSEKTKLSEPIRHQTLIGQRITKMDAPEKVEGKTRYIHDINLSAAHVRPPRTSRR